MIKKKSYRRFVRINGELVPSPRFSSKEDADEWFEKMKKKAQFGKFGLTPKIKQDDIPLFMTLAASWFDQREQEYGKNTTAGEDRNLRNHILPAFGTLQVNKITHVKIDRFLKNLTVTKTLKGGQTVRQKASSQTRNKIKSLLSAFFDSLLDVEDDQPKYIEYNPVLLLAKRRLRKGKRVATGPKIPKKILKTDEACLKFLEAAKTIGNGAVSPAHKEMLGRTFVYASLLVMLGPRASEVMALRWQDIDFENTTVTFAWIYERESKLIIERTKQGEQEFRIIPLPADLAQILNWWHKTTPYNKPTDFILSKPGGGNMSWRTVRQMHDRLNERAGTNVSPHGLRHTFGRLFNKKTGNLGALQKILGHSSSKTTEIYSELDAEHLQEFADDMGLKGGVTLPKFQTNRSIKE